MRNKRHHSWKQALVLVFSIIELLFSLLSLLMGGFVMVFISQGELGQSLRQAFEEAGLSPASMGVNSYDSIAMTGALLLAIGFFYLLSFMFGVRAFRDGSKAIPFAVCSGIDLATVISQAITGSLSTNGPLDTALSFGIPILTLALGILVWRDSQVGSALPVDELEDVATDADGGDGGR